MAGTKNIQTDKTSDFGSENGAAAVEFAMTAGLFLTILFAIISYGFYFATLIILEQAVSEGARAAVAGLTNAERITLSEAAIDQTLTAWAGFVDPAFATVTAAPDPQNAALFEIEIVYDYAATGMGAVAQIVPMPNEMPTVTAVISNGGL